MRLFMTFFMLCLIIFCQGEIFAVTRAVFMKGNEIWTVNEDGSNEKQLTSDGTEKNGAPVWSPDGTKIAYFLSYAYANPVAKVIIIDTVGNVLNSVEIERGTLKEVKAIEWIDNEKMGIEGIASANTYQYLIITDHR